MFLEKITRYARGRQSPSWSPELLVRKDAGSRNSDHDHGVILTPVAIVARFREPPIRDRELLRSRAAEADMIAGSVFPREAIKYLCSTDPCRHSISLFGPSG